MRILIDESLPHKLANDLKTYDVATVRKQGWTGLRNGVLLRAAIDAGFHVLITADQSLEYQQNLSALRIAVVVIAGVRNRLDDVRQLLPQILDALTTIRPGEVIRIARRDSVSDRALGGPAVPASAPAAPPA